MDNKNKKIYFVGIEGAGTSALAQLYKNIGFEVLGSDNGDHFYGSVLKDKNIQVFHDFNKNNVPSDIEFAVHSTAFKDDNPEIEEIKKRNIPLYNYAQALGNFYEKKIGISVCGSHGKTTTTAMLSEAFRNAGLDPTALVGSNVIKWQTNVMLGHGDYFIAEADEYQNKLQYYNPWSVILTSVDWDHPDFFEDFEAYKNVFKDFVSKIPKTGFLIVWGDSSHTLEVAESSTGQVRSYGFGDDNDYRVVHQGSTEKDSICLQKFEIFFEETSLGEFETPLLGRHNVLNCAAIIALSHAMHLDLSKIKQALNDFKGTSRRFEIVGKFKEAILVDDYAHHPDEIKATLSGARDRFGDKSIWTVFHPHTFTRTAALLEDFAQSFDFADKVIVIDIYGSAREQRGGVTSEILVNKINKYYRGKAEYIPTIDEAAEYFRQHSGEYDLLITMGAGDVWKVAAKLKED